MDCTLSASFKYVSRGMEHIQGKNLSKLILTPFELGFTLRDAIRRG